MRGRFYSPAWHCFLNPDQGADPSQLNQYAYAGGNPMVNVDPSGMSWLSNLFHHVDHALSVDWDHLRHQADVNWDDGRGDIELGAAVLAFALIDVATCGEGTPLDDSILDLSSLSSASNAAIAATATGTIGAAYGGAVNGWKGALDGAVFAIGMAYGVDDGFYICNTSNAPLADLGNQAYNLFIPKDPSMGQLGISMLKGAVINSAFGSRNQTQFFNNFAYGAASGLASGAIDDIGFNMGLNPLGRIPGEIAVNRMFALGYGNPIWGPGSWAMPGISGGLGYLHGMYNALF